MKKKIIFIILSFFMLTSFGYADTTKELVTLDDCVDGDTARFNYNGEKVRFRFLGIDTPESVHPTKRVQAYGKEASKYTCDLLKSANKIYVEFDPKSDKSDKYGRNLAWVWIDGVLLEQILIKDGYAQVAYVYGKYQHINDLCYEQEIARNNKVGIWNEDREVGYCGTIDYSKGKSLDKNIYTVNYKNDGKIIKTLSVVEGRKIKKIKAPKKDGFIFDGWFIKDEEFDFSKPIVNNVNLEAKYSLDYYYVIITIIVLLIALLTGKISNKRILKKWKK